jgi:hypothetical protein
VLPSVARALIGSIITISSGSIEANIAKEMIVNWLKCIDLPLCTLLGQGPETVNITLVAYCHWVGEGNTLRVWRAISPMWWYFWNTMKLTTPDASRGIAGWTASWPAHCDWVILGLFAGYRIRELGQTDNCSYGNCARRARGDGSGEFSWTPLEACQPDFLFFNFCSDTVPYSNKLNCLGFMEIRFRWQKSQRHGQVRTFMALPNDPLCPVARARRILLQAETLRILPWSPVAVFRIPKTGVTTYVKRIIVERFLKKALTMAYPDPNHRLCHLEKYFMSHCLHILACLALASAGTPHDDIVYRLRWNSATVEFYIRESQQSVTNLSAAVMQGTYDRGSNPADRKPPLSKRKLCAAQRHT